jgi:serine protease Do
MGLRVRSLTDDERAELKLTTGVMIAEVQSASVAEDAGLEPGQVIEEINTKPISTPSEFAAALRDARASHKAHVALLVTDGQRTSYVTLPVTDK